MLSNPIAWNSREVESLSDIPGLESLTAVARAHRVRFGAIGSLCRRLLWAQHLETFHAQDIFDLVPFTSDIDIVHTGSDSDSSRILADIIERVPLAEAFRWQVLSKERWSEIRAHKSVVHRVPQDDVQLWDRGLVDPNGAAEELSRRRLNLRLNPRYSESEEFGSDRDLECFAALFYLRDLAQVQPYLRLTPDEFAAQPGLGVARGIFENSIERGDEKKLSTSAYSRTKLTYLVAGVVTSCNEPWVLEMALKQGGLDPLVSAWSKEQRWLEKVWSDLMASAREGQPLLLSAHLRSDDFRLAKWTVKVQQGTQADRLLTQSLGENLSGEAAMDPQVHRDIAVLASEALELNEGVPWYAEPAPGQFHEPLHLHVPLSPALHNALREVAAEDLSVALSLESRSQANQDQPGLVFAVPASCSYRGGHPEANSALQIRANCYGVLVAAQDISEKLNANAKATVRLFVITPGPAA